MTATLMQNHTQIIQLSDHVKNRIQQSRSPSLNSASDEHLTLPSVFSSSDDGDSSTSSFLQSMPRPRRDTFTIHKLKPPSESSLFFTAANPTRTTTNVSFLQQLYQQQNSRDQQQQPCLECSRRDRLLHLEHQRLLRLYEDNRKLADQLRSFISLNHLYQEENHKLQDDLNTINAHLQEYQIHFDQLKQKIESNDKKMTSKIEEKNQTVVEEVTVDRLKQLRHEVQAYKRKKQLMEFLF